MIQHFGGTAKVQSARSCVVYEAESGRIHHVHHSITLEGAQESGEREMEDFALNSLRQRGVNAANLQVLHVPGDAIEPGIVYSVDPKGRSLVAKRRV